MSSANNTKRPARSDEDLARMVVNIAKATQVDGIICITETGLLAQHLFRLAGHFHVIATTTNSETFDILTRSGLEVIRLPLHTADKYTQIRHAISVVLQSSGVSIGDLVVCAIGHDVYREEGNLVVLTEMEASIEKLAVSDLLKLTDGIQPKVLEAAVLVACKIGLAARCRCRGYDAYDGDRDRCLRNRWPRAGVFRWQDGAPNRSRCRPWAYQYE